MLFLRLDRDSEGRPRVFARSNNVAEDTAGVVSSAGSEGGCIMEGILVPLRAGLWMGSSDGGFGFA